MDFFDLHCDTAYRMYRENLKIDSELLDTRLSDFKGFERAVQLYAIYSDNSKEDEENYEDFFKVCEYLKSEINENYKEISLCTERPALEAQTTPVKAILAVEGSKLLAGDLSRLSILHGLGVRVLTFAWKGDCRACGAHDTDKGLTEFGFELLSECERTGICVDVSHLSEKGFWDIAAKATKPYIATHSSSYSLCAHTRNLTDIQFRTICERGGIVGVNMYPQFLSPRFCDGCYSTDELVGMYCDHIEHFLSLGGESHVCLGADRDGIERIDGYTQLVFADKVYERLVCNGIKTQVIDDIFYNNAYKFFRENL